jgi:hypothetical protein
MERGRERGREREGERGREREREGGRVAAVYRSRNRLLLYTLLSLTFIDEQIYIYCLKKYNQCNTIESTNEVGAHVLEPANRLFACKPSFPLSFLFCYEMKNGKCGSLVQENHNRCMLFYGL